MTDEHSDLQRRIKAAAPFDRVAITRALAEAMDSSQDTISFAGEGEVASRLAALLNAALGKVDPLSFADPAQARAVADESLLLAMADPALASALGEAVAKHEADDSMNAIEVLSDAAALSVVILVATTQVEWTAGKRLRIVKRALGEHALLRLIGIVEKILKIEA